MTQEDSDPSRGALNAYIKSRWTIQLVYLLSLLVIVGVQAALMATFIPEKLAAFSSSPAIHDYVEMVISKIFNMWLIVAALAIISPVSQLLGMYRLRKGSLPRDELPR